MTTSGIDNHEFLVPDWRNGRAYARTHGESAVVNQVKEILSSRWSSTSSVDTEVAKSEIETFFPQLTRSLRITDLRDATYWLTMIAICVFFLIVEIVVIGLSTTNGNHHNVLLVQTVVICGLLVPVILMLLVYSVVIVNCKTGRELPPSLRRIKPQWLHMLPVLWLAIGLMAVNLWLVAATGWRASPFLPAFLAAALTVIGLPRENSGLIVWLSIITVVVASTVCVWSTSLDGKTLQTILEAWGAGSTGNLPFYINALTFGVAALLTMVLRHFSLRIGETS